MELGMRTLILTLTNVLETVIQQVTSWFCYQSVFKSDFYLFVYFRLIHTKKFTYK